MEWWQIVIGAVVGLFSLMLLVIVHELGHAWAAMRSGVKVEEFAIGFPPRAKILGKYKGILITLNWLLPLGGFCKMKGDDDFAGVKGKELEARKNKSRDSDSFEGSSFWSKTKILFAGVVINFVVACVIMTVLAWIGMPKIMDSQFTMPGDTKTELSPVMIVGVVEGSPAEKIGLRDGFIIKSINGEEIVKSSEVSKLTEKYKGQTVEISFIFPKGEIQPAGGIACDIDGEGCNDQVYTEPEEEDIQVMKHVQLNADRGSTGYLGVMTGQSEKFRATWSAPIVGIINSAQFVWETIAGVGGMIGNLFGGLWGLITGGGEAAQQQISSVGESVAGPVGILGVIFPAVVAAGFTELLFLVGVISLTLTVMNILPIPGLDGGRWYLIAGFKLFKKKLTKEREETIVSIGMLVLFGLVIAITVSDIWKLF